MSNIVKIEEGLRGLDVGPLIVYTRKLEDISKGFNTMLAPIYLRDFIIAYDYTSTLYAKAIRILGQAESFLKECEAIAYFDHASDFLSSKSIKDSDAARRRYVDLDEAVLNARDARAKAEAMVALLKNKLHSFRSGHDDVKKIAYSNDYTNDSPNEGM